MKRIVLALAAVIICMIQPVNADTLWTCIPESGNPSTKMLFITVADDKISVFDVSGKEILVAPLLSTATAPLTESSFRPASSNTMSSCTASALLQMRQVLRQK